MLRPLQKILAVPSGQCFRAMKTNSANAGGTEGPCDPDPGPGEHGPLHLQEIHFLYVKSEHLKWF